MKIIAFYLPQFHSIPENDEWWGKGFTEWVNVKKADSYYEGHFQPRIPLNNNYYDLLDVNVMKWQTNIARENGVYGFCLYHYWFGGKLLLEKPIENYLNNTDIDFPYCICWANEHWTNQWVSAKSNVLIEQTYGGKKEWEAHFNYILPFFLDNRYLKKDGKPIFVIYRPDLIDSRKDMVDYWNQLAVEAGIPGICFMFQRPDAIQSGIKADVSIFDYCIEYQPGVELRNITFQKNSFKSLRKIKSKIMIFAEKKLGVSTDSLYLSKLKNKNEGPEKYSYDVVWQNIINAEPLYENSIPGAFVNWDNTPRKGKRGFVIDGASTEKFKKYLSMQIKHTRKDYHQDMLFLFAWNEWAEGGYLEPDEQFGYGFLNAIKEALIENDEFPKQLLGGDICQK